MATWEVKIIREPRRDVLTDIEGSQEARIRYGLSHRCTALRSSFGRAVTHGGM